MHSILLGMAACGVAMARRLRVGVGLGLLAAALPMAVAGDDTAPAPADGRPEYRIGQMRMGQALERRYPGALNSLLRHVNETTTFRVVDEPVLLESFADERLLELPFVYVNFADRQEWTFGDEEAAALRGYLERGGFLFVDAGITAEFLREDVDMGQHHSFAEWQAHPDLEQAFATVFPEKAFQSLPRAHPLFRIFYQGLPDTSTLPDTVRTYTEQEKWPDGTYSAVGLTVGGRLAVLVTPIIAMGWGRDNLGNWATTIRFRVREGTAGLSEYLRTAAYSGARFEAAREDGGRDVIYCQERGMPAWVQEPSGNWRVFRYYAGREISDFAHVFYTQLGTNILVYALTH